MPGTVKIPHVSARVQVAIETFIAQLRRRQIYGSHAVSEKMLDILRMVVSSGKWGNVDNLMDLIKLVGKRCQEAQPMELCTGNIVRRLLSVIREECHAIVMEEQREQREQQLARSKSAAASATTTTGKGQSKPASAAGSRPASAKKSPALASLALAPIATSAAVTGAGADVNALAAGLGNLSVAGSPSSVGSVPPTSPHGSHLHHHQLAPHTSVFSLFAETDAVRIDYGRIKSTTTKSMFVEAINEMLDEMRNLHDSIAAQSVAHIHSNEIILTCGDATTTLNFFKHAAKKRQFHVIVVESAPVYSGHQLARKLAAAGIETTVIPDSAVFAVMSRVNKVVLGTHAILANGGLVALSGATTLAVAAKHYAIPVVVTAGLYKLTPLHPFDLDVFNLLGAPATVADEAGDTLAAGAEVLNPYFDYVAPELVALFITNEGVYAPSYMYRLLTESYHPDDVSLELSPGAWDRFFPKTAAAATAGVAGTRKVAPVVPVVRKPAANEGSDEDVSSEGEQ
ncbi:hypothetical protein AMAG_05115 [Allomyces macrogynus ATCC 38327]|uniref:Translation initiation factor eIF2B subunit beta n=1 Tax=Allomyces macrogynus (strain ATCC 38327) TaxID=578462 RepID=A0A0L0S700_ALLM3|nr:hypothetical protein AMAG_05115 [Allomyces macrogynus ATCC 38327]|eukprot:KNE58307.1 hypothetical protein AMAG_05115 [Allomyces macrogynus ATCC 38327]